MDEELEKATLDAMWYQPEFQVIIEDHLTLLQKHQQNQYIEVHPNDAYRFEGDYYNLLRFKGVPYRYHWVLLRVNGYLSPFDSGMEVKRIIVPPYEVLERIMNMHIMHIKPQ